MKMSVGTRIVLSLFLTVIIAVCGLIIAATFGAFSADDIWALTAGFTETAYKYIWAAAAMSVWSFFGGAEATAACSFWAVPASASSD